jgi:succinoglycan biosynthesis protein ExoM
MSSGTIKAAVCIPTFHRPDGLARLLGGMQNLEFHKAPRPDIRVVVVDNDAEGSGAEAFHSVMGGSAIEAAYFVEPTRGVSVARNAALRHAQGADFVAFTDDDAVPDSRWLDELLYVQRESSADIVVGRIESYFVDPPPRWIEEGGYYRRRRHVNGTVIDHVDTANVLLTRQLLDRLGGHGWQVFDERLALRGGADAFLGKQAVREGFKIVWADDAVVHEWLPPAKVGVGWILQRAVRGAQTDTYIDMELSTSRDTARARRFFLGAGRIAAGIAMMIPWSLAALFRGRHLALQPVRIVTRGVGMVMATLGVWYEEYRNVYKAWSVEDLP